MGLKSLVSLTRVAVLHCLLYGVAFKLQFGIYNTKLMWTDMHCQICHVLGYCLQPRVYEIVLCGSGESPVTTE